jgi:hypothetical protein
MKKLKLQFEDFDSKERNLLKKVVTLGTTIRKCQDDGNLTSLAPPTVYGYLNFIRLSKKMPQLSLPQVANLTLLGNASSEDDVSAVLNEVFGIRDKPDDDDPTMGGDLF